MDGSAWFGPGAPARSHAWSPLDPCLIPACFRFVARLILHGGRQTAHGTMARLCGIAGARGSFAPPLSNMSRSSSNSRPPFSRPTTRSPSASFARSNDARRPQRLADVLARTDAFSALRAGVEQIAALERDLTELLPDYLAASVEPGFIKDGVLALFAAHNALAARLRHLAPRLLSDLQQRGWPVNALKIRVRPQSMKEPPRVKQARMSRAGADALHELSETLGPSPLRE